MEILLMRHGQSLADLEDRHEGRADFPLTKLGEEQAALAALWINEHYPPDRILTSPLQRAFKTATLVAQLTGAPLSQEAELMEWNNGLLAGLLREEAARLYPLPAGGRKPHHKFAETESSIEFRARAEAFWSRFVCDYIEAGNHKRILLVSHGGMINMLFQCFLSLPMNFGIVWSTGDTGIHLWRVTPEKRAVVFANKQDHLLAPGRG